MGVQRWTSHILFPLKELEVAQSCPTLSDPMDCSLPGSSVCGILQAKTLEQVANAFSQCMLSTELINGSSLIGLPYRGAQLVKNLPSIQETLV